MAIVIGDAHGYLRVLGIGMPGALLRASEDEFVDPNRQPRLSEVYQPETLDPQVLTEWKAHDGEVTDVRVLGGPKSLTTTGRDRTVKIWSMALCPAEAGAPAADSGASDDVGTGSLSPQLTRDPAHAQVSSEDLSSGAGDGQSNENGGEAAALAQLRPGTRVGPLRQTCGELWGVIDLRSAAAGCPLGGPASWILPTVLRTSLLYKYQAFRVLLKLKGESEIRRLQLAFSEARDQKRDSERLRVKEERRRLEQQAAQARQARRMASDSERTVTVREGRRVVRLLAIDPDLRFAPGELEGGERWSTEDRPLTPKSLQDRTIFEEMTQAPRAEVEPKYRIGSSAGRLQERFTAMEQEATRQRKARAGTGSPRSAVIRGEGLETGVSPRGGFAGPGDLQANLKRGTLGGAFNLANLQGGYQESSAAREGAGTTGAAGALPPGGGGRLDHLAEEKKAAAAQGRLPAPALRRKFSPHTSVTAEEGKAGGGGRQFLAEDGSTGEPNKGAREQSKGMQALSSTANASLKATRSFKLLEQIDHERLQAGERLGIMASTIGGGGKQQQRSQQEFGMMSFAGRYRPANHMKSLRRSRSSPLAAPKLAKTKPPGDPTRPHGLTGGHPGQDVGWCGQTWPEELFAGHGGAESVGANRRPPSSASGIFASSAASQLHSASGTRPPSRDAGSRPSTRPGGQYASSVASEFGDGGFRPASSAASTKDPNSRPPSRPAQTAGRKKIL